MLFWKFRWLSLSLVVLIFAVSNFLRSSNGQHGPVMAFVREIISAFSPALASYAAARLVGMHLRFSLRWLCIFFAAISGFIAGKILLDMTTPLPSVLTPDRLPGELLRMALFAAPLSLLAAVSQPEAPAVLYLRSSEGEVRVTPAEIVFVEQRQRKTFICYRGEEFQVKQSLRDLEKKLRPFGIVRIHKQYLVNPVFIQVIQPQGSGRYLVRMTDDEDTVLVAGRTYARALREQFKKK